MPLPRPDMTPIQIFVFFGGIQVTIVTVIMLIITLVSFWHPQILLPKKYASELDTERMKKQYVRLKRFLLFLFALSIIPLFIVYYTYAISLWIFAGIIMLYLVCVCILNFRYFGRIALSF